MRKMESSANADFRMALSCRAEARSRPNGFSTITRALVAASGLLQTLDHRAEQGRWNGQVMQRPGGVAQHLLEPLEGGCVVVVAIDVAQPRRQFRERSFVDPATLILRGLCDAAVGALAQLFQCLVGVRHTDDRQIPIVVELHDLQRREDLLVGQIAGGAEEDQRVRLLLAIGACWLHWGTSDCPLRRRIDARKNRRMYCVTTCRLVACQASVTPYGG